MQRLFSIVVALHNGLLYDIVCEPVVAKETRTLYYIGNFSLYTLSGLFSIG